MSLDTAIKVLAITAFVCWMAAALLAYWSLR